jgi:hypothetical protein
MPRIINGCDERDVQTGERQVRKLNWHKAIQEGGGAIITGPMNAHSRRWDPRCRQQRDAMFGQQIVDEYGLEIGNDDWSTNHWVSTCEGVVWTIMVTLATRPST